MKKKRLVEFDILKGICILLVIIGHSRPFFPVYEFLYSFHVPLFFIVSGYFFSIKENLGGAFYKNGSQLLKPYVIVSIVICVLYVFFQDHSEIIIKESLLGVTIPNSYLISIGPAWFFLALFFCRFFYRIIYCTFRNIAVVTVIILVLSTSMVLLEKHTQLIVPYQLPQSVVGLFYYHVGYLFSLNKEYVFKLFRLRNRNCAIVEIMISLLIVFICVYYYHRNSAAMNFATISFPCFPFDLLNAVLLSLSIYLIVIKMVSYEKVKMFNDFLSWIGCNSIVVYCIHCIQYHFTIDPIATYVDDIFSTKNVLVYCVLRLINPILQIAMCIIGLYFYQFFRLKYKNRNNSFKY